MKRILIVALLAIVLAGCETNFENTEASPERFQTKCLDGVQYYILRETPAGYQGYGYMSVKYNRDGTISTC